MAELTESPIDVEALASSVAGDGDGALATFVGRVRDSNEGRRVIRLEYESYGPMARRELERLEQQARERFEINGIALVHRVGTLEIGEASVAVAVAAAHRGAAFDACRWAIDTLKRTVPIWKKEHFEGGEVWVEGPPDPPGGVAGDQA